MDLKIYPLHQSPLYKLSSRKRLATLLGFNLNNLESLAGRVENYHEFDVVHANKNRHVQVPKRALERVHRRLFNFFERIEKPSYLHSGTRGRSYITNSKVHIGLVPVAKLDIRKFYPSVNADRIFRFFKETMRCSPDVAGLLAKLTTVDGHVPIGSCLSQLLAYFVAKPMFDALSAESGPDIRFTCYVDDLTWSGIAATPSFLWRMKQVVHRHGFGYHSDKIYDAADIKVITGVIINGDLIKVKRSAELAQWRELHALDEKHGAERLKALERLIGKAAASSQIEQRFLSRIAFLQAKRKFEMKLLGQSRLAVLAAPRGIKPALPP